MSATAEDALNRAKVIAARLSGNDVAPTATAGNVSSPGTAAPSSGTTTKRKRWGVAPAIVAAAQETLPGLEAAKKAKTTGGEQKSKRIWVPTTKERPPSHFFSFFSSRLEEIGDKVNAENPGATEKVKLELKGRGSSNRPPLPGIPEEPMHVIISGPDDLITKADTLLDVLISEAERAPCEVVPVEESKTNNALALATTHQSTSAYRPATVAQMISNNPVLHNDGEDLLEEAINVPNGIVGFVIGRGGETISSMQARSGCKIQIQKEHELQPGQTHRVITLQATTQDSIDHCRGMIESMVQDRIRAAGGSSNSGSKDVKINEAVSAGHHLVKVEVPDADVGLISKFATCLSFFNAFLDGWCILLTVRCAFELIYLQSVRVEQRSSQSKTPPAQVSRFHRLEIQTIHRFGLLASHAKMKRERTWRNGRLKTC